MNNDEDVDLRYLQCESFVAEFHRPRVRPRNRFMPRLATKLKPGFSGQFDLETIVVVLEAAARLRPGRVIYCRLDYQGDGAQLEICSIAPDMVSICADMAENLLPALNWYRAQGDSHIYLAVASPYFFWLPLPTGTQWDK